MCASLQFRGRPEKYFYRQRDVENYTDQDLDFLLFDTGLSNSFFVLQDLIDKINTYFKENSFSEKLPSYWLLAI